DVAADHRRRPQPARPGRDTRCRLHLRGHRAPAPCVAARAAGRTRPGAQPLMEALLLAGGKAERLGEAAQGLPEPLLPVPGLPPAEYSVGRLIAAGVTRVIVACRAGQEEAFVNALTGLGAEIEAVGEEEPLGRGGGLRLAASRRQENGTVLALNGDELLDVDFPGLIAE